MITYETKLWFCNGKLLKDGDVIPEGGRLELRTVRVQPEVFIDVWNFEAKLAVYLYLRSGGSVKVVYAEETPEEVDEGMAEDVWKQGSLSRSGWYKITDHRVKRFIRSKQFQNWLRSVLTRFGLGAG